MSVNYGTWCPYERIITLLVHSRASNGASSVTITIGEGLDEVSRTIDLTNAELIAKRQAGRFIPMRLTGNGQTFTVAQRERFLSKETVNGSATYSFPDGTTTMWTFTIYHILRKKVKVLKEYRDGNSEFRPVENSIGLEKSFYIEAMKHIPRYNDFKFLNVGDAERSEYTSCYTYVPVRIDSGNHHLVILGPALEERNCHFATLDLAGDGLVDLYASGESLARAGISSAFEERQNEEDENKKNHNSDTFMGFIPSLYVRLGGGAFVGVDLWQSPIIGNYPIDSESYFKLLMLIVYGELTRGSGTTIDMSKYDFIKTDDVIPSPYVDVMLRNGRWVITEGDRFDKMYDELISSNLQIRNLTKWFMYDSNDAGIYMSVPSYITDEFYKTKTKRTVDKQTGKTTETLETYSNKDPDDRIMDYLTYGPDYYEGRARDMFDDPKKVFISSAAAPTSACYALASSKYFCSISDSSLYAQLRYLIKAVCHGWIRVAQSKNRLILWGNTRALVNEEAATEHIIEGIYGNEAFSAKLKDFYNLDELLANGGDGIVLIGMDRVAAEADNDPDHYFVARVKDRELYVAYDPFPGYISQEFKPGFNFTARARNLSDTVKAGILFRTLSDFQLIGRNDQSSELFTV